MVQHFAVQGPIHTHRKNIYLYKRDFKSLRKTGIFKNVKSSYNFPIFLSLRNLKNSFLHVNKYFHRFFNYIIIVMYYIIYNHITGGNKKGFGVRGLDYTVLQA